MAGENALFGLGGSIVPLRVQGDGHEGGANGDKKQRDREEEEVVGRLLQEHAFEAKKRHGTGEGQHAKRPRKAAAVLLLLRLNARLGLAELDVLGHAALTAGPGSGLATAGQKPIVRAIRELLHLAGGRHKIDTSSVLDRLGCEVADC